MKLILLSLLTLIAATGIAQTYQTSPPVALPSAYGNYHPQIEITNDNQPAVIWTSPTLKNLYFSKHNGIDDFNTPIQLNPSGLNVQSYNWSGPDLAMWQDDIYVVFKENGYTDGKIFVVKSTDNGATFGDTVRVDNLATGFGNYPDIAVFNDTVYVTFMDHDSTGMDPQYVVARSVDGGASFQAEVIAGEILGDEACDCCQPEIVVNDKYVVVFLRNNQSNIRDIKGIVSYDRGATFTNWISVDDHNWAIMACPSTGPDARILDNDSVLVAYKSEWAGQARVYLHQYDLNSDMSVTEVELSMGTGTNPNYPQLCYNEGRLGAVWEGQGVSTDVFFNPLIGGIAAFDTSATINLTDTAGSQSKPDIAFQSGVYHVVYSEGALGGIKYIKVFNPLEVNEVPAGVEMSVYPNPVTDQMHLDLEINESIQMDIQIFDANSRLVYIDTWNTSAGQNRIAIPVGDYPPGLYQVQLKTKNWSLQEKLIKQ